MDAYIYQAALLCHECAGTTVLALGLSEQENTGDSDDFPQGPYADGGGEADVPQHCDKCNVFLQNPLTSDGYAFIRALERVPFEWEDFYGEEG